MAGQSRYIHSVDEEVKNDYRERTYAKDVQSTVGGESTIDVTSEGQLCWLE